MYCHSINRPTISFLMGWGGGGEGFWVNLVLPIIFFNAFIHHEFFSGAFSCIRCFFSASNMEKLPLFIIIPSSFYNIPISRKDFEWGYFFLGILFICRTITIITKRCQRKIVGRDGEEA